MTLVRCRNNPVLTRGDIPDVPPYLVDATSVFNPGAIRFNDQQLLLLRVQSRGRQTYIMKAESDDGEAFTVSDQVITFNGLDRVEGRIFHLYDVRITPLEGKYYLMFAMDMDVGCRLGLAVTSDFVSYEFLGVVSGNDNRNGVLFSEKFDQYYLRLERPNRCDLPGNPSSGSTIVLSESTDLINWSQRGVVLAGRPHYWDELIGPGPPPVKTREGWLCLYHGIATHFASVNIYQAGVALLDLTDPSRVQGRGRDNILEPREIYELTGQVPNVVFPSGMIVEETDDDGFALPESAVHIYYGAADTVVGKASAVVADLLAACHEQ